MGSRRADAERNIAAIIATGLDVLSRDPGASMADIAKAAGLGRVTVYAHFPTRADLVEALVRHAIAETERAFDQAPPAAGEPADVTLTRLLGTAWQVLDRYRAVRAHAVVDLGNEQLNQRHDPVRHRLAEVVERGRDEGRFRTDLPVDWLVTTIFSLVHTAADEVQAGRLTPEEAPRLLTSTLLAALCGTTCAGG